MYSEPWPACSEEAFVPLPRFSAVPQISVLPPSMGPALGPVFDYSLKWLTYETKTYVTLKYNERSSCC